MAAVAGKASPDALRDRRARGAGNAVIRGAELSERQLNYLSEAGILGPGEEIEYFYSASPLSIRYDGQFISDQYVTSYWKSFGDEEAQVAYAAYEDIANVQVRWSESVLEDTVVQITTHDDYSFEVWLSAEGGGDQTFVKALNRFLYVSKQRSAKRSGEASPAVLQGD